MRTVQVELDLSVEYTRTYVRRYARNQLEMFFKRLLNILEEKDAQSYTGEPIIVWLTMNDSSQKVLYTL